MLQSVMEIHSLRQKLAAERDLRYRAFCSLLCLHLSCACQLLVPLWTSGHLSCSPCVVQVLSDCCPRADDAFASAALPAWIKQAACSCGSACAMTPSGLTCHRSQHQRAAKTTMISQPPALVWLESRSSTVSGVCQPSWYSDRHLGGMCQQSLQC